MQPVERALREIDDVVRSGPYASTWDSLRGYTVPEWYQDDKFGIFIHWGVYSVPAFGSEWYPRNMYRQGSKEFEHHVATYGPHTEFGYKDFVPQFKAERFDAEHWADLFQQAGARFVVPVAEHHDGFPMYDCQFSEWNAARMGPQQNIVGKLAAAVRKRGMVFGVSSHRAEHWWFFDGGMKFDSDVQDPRYAGLCGPAEPEGTQPDQAFLDDWLARCCELVDKYQPQLFWFDWWIEQPAFAPYLQKFAAYYYNRAAQWGKGVAINYKHHSFPEEAAVLDIERGQLADIRPLFWQTDTAVSKNSWGYIQNQEYKTVSSIIGDLVDIVSKNGALLLNIGPRPDGTIPEPEEEMLREVGRWLSVNGEAIYGTRPWKVFGEGPTEVSSGSFTDTKRAAFTSEDIRFTTKGDTLYAIALGVPEGEMTIRSLGTHLRLAPREIAKVEMLGTEQPLHWSRDEAGLRITPPSERSGEHAVAYKITFADRS
jgi:alpha-L-fucosidase